MKKFLTMIVVFAIMFCVSIGLGGCVDYGYSFHYYVDGGNGEIAIKTTEKFNLGETKCNEFCEIDCPENSRVVCLMGGRKGSHELTFTAIPQEGYQVKEWEFNGEIVEGNKTNFCTMRVSDRENYNGVIIVRFETIK